MRDGFDFIIIGAGSAGCVLARRLSEAGDAKVALIEAGGSPDPVLSSIPGAAPRQFGTKSDWRFRTVPQKGLHDRMIDYPRGRGLGGSSVLNFMIYVRGNAGDFNEWAQLGNKGWGYDDVLPYFIRAEANAEFDDAFHGTDGPLAVSRNAHAHPLCDVFFEAAQQSGIEYNSDINGADQFGCGFMQATIRDGVRCSTARAYLDPVSGSENLTIIKEAFVTRIVIEKGRAVAVEYLENGKGLRRLNASAEIILAAGAIGSPHLLMLSGIGPARPLREHGIDVVLDNPDVGQNLEDHYSQDGVTRRLKNPGAIDRELPASFDDAVAEFQKTGGGHLATMGIDAVAFHSVDPGTAYPQFQSIFSVKVPDVFRVAGRRERIRLALGGYPCRMRSRGSVSLASSNPIDAPLIDPNYFSDPEDMRLMKALHRRNAEILNAPAFDAVCDGPAEPALDDEAELEDYIRQTASTIWHTSSTCRMGPGDGAVVGPDLSVHGIEALSICDASVMPTMTSGNINAPVVMIAEKGSDLIRDRHHAPISRGSDVRSG